VTKQHTKNNDIRLIFDKMAAQAIVSKNELADLLNTTPAAISQMSYRNELPPYAFPGKRRACWYAKVLQDWLDRISTSTFQVTKEEVPDKRMLKKIGRPRHMKE
jgi:hypothetical protein